MNIQVSGILQLCFTFLQNVMIFFFFLVDFYTGRLNNFFQSQTGLALLGSAQCLRDSVCLDKQSRFIEGECLISPLAGWRNGVLGQHHCTCPFPLGYPLVVSPYIHKGFAVRPFPWSMRPSQRRSLHHWLSFLISTFQDRLVVKINEEFVD